MNVLQITIMFINTFCIIIVTFKRETFHIVQISKFGFGSAMRNFSMNDAQDPYEHEEDVMGENICVGDAETESNGRRLQETPPYFAITM